MTVTINTTQGTFIVPSEKHDMLIQWLQVNAVRYDQQFVREIKGAEQHGDVRRLINE
jgi:hypothetical protein